MSENRVDGRADAMLRHLNRLTDQYLVLSQAWRRYWDTPLRPVLNRRMDENHAEFLRWATYFVTYCNEQRRNDGE